MNPYCTAQLARPPIGLIAGWGVYPLVVADGLRQHDYAVHVVGIRGHVDQQLASRCDSFRELGLTRLGAHIRFLRQQGVRQAIFAGKIHKVLFFQPGFFRNNWPDWQCLRTFFPHFVTGRQDRTDNSLLLAAVAAYARGGIEILSATTLLPELLVRQSMFGGNTLTRAQVQDVEFGWRLARQMGGLDIGQTVVVKGQAVLAVEAVEGTDACIRRAGGLCPAGGFTVVKIAKPDQDMRFDVPTIGIGTLQTLQQVGAAVLAIESDRTIVIDQPQVAKFARQHGITVVALRHGKLAGDLLRAA
jgi:hypothetical protein